MTAFPTLVMSPGSPLLLNRAAGASDPSCLEDGLRHGPGDRSRLGGARNRCPVQSAVEQHQELSTYGVWVASSPFGSLLAEPALDGRFMAPGDSGYLRPHTLHSYRVVKRAPVVVGG